MVSLSFAAECKRCTKIVKKFIKPGIKDPTKAWTPDQYIPNDIFMKAKGLAILTVFKAGFMWGGCVGTGLVLARLVNGGWSAPSAIALGGISFGAQIGGEVIYLVVLLNTDAAVKAFSHGGNFTLGGQLSVSAGPFGRTGEVKGSARNYAALFSYSKSKGLFAGISIEGSVITERTNTNHNFYKRAVTPKELLTGVIPVPYEAQPLIQALSPWTGAQVETVPTPFPPYEVPNPAPLVVSTATAVPPMYPPASSRVSPHVLSTPTSSALPTVRALFDFHGERPGDLPFRKGDMITVIQQGHDQNEWWVGRCNGREGPFPANYCDVHSLTQHTGSPIPIHKAA